MLHDYNVEYCSPGWPQMSDDLLFLPFRAEMSGMGTTCGSLDVIYVALIFVDLFL